MTDNEIIKALECCLKGCNAEGCDDCPLYEKVEDCEIEIPIIALDLINRQKAEIERLKALQYDRGQYEKGCKDGIVSGIRDFAKFLIDKAENGVICVADMPDLVREMMEGGNNGN